ncbi:MAG: hypothetical protein U1F66_00685 [bacterium]
MALALACLKSILLFTLTGLSLFRLAPRAIREIHSWTDRILLSLLTGIAFYTIFFLLAQGLFSLPLTTATVWGVFALILASGAGVEIYRRRRHLSTGFEEDEATKPLESEAPTRPWLGRLLKEGLLLATLGLIFFFSLNIRLQNGLKWPDKLLDADPYRHHIRTEALIQTGHLSKYDPYLVGEVPIFELQGCYILAGVLGISGPFSAWALWAWGSQVFGALSTLSLYLFAKLGLRDIVQDDLGPPPKAKKKGPAPPALSADLVATFLGLVAAALWGASPVHILRTNAGFSEAYAIPMLAPALLFYLWAAQSRIWGDFVWFGVFFTALAFINPVPAVFVVPFFAVHALHVYLKTRDKRWLWGNLLAGGIFLACLLVWNWKFLATPLFTGALATGKAGTEGILKAMGQNPTFWEKLHAGWQTFSQEIFRNLGFFNLAGRSIGSFFATFGLDGAGTKRFLDYLAVGGAFAGAFWILWNPREGKRRIHEGTSFFFLSYVFFFLILFLIPFGFISFTSKYYRYLLPISLSLSCMFAYFLWRLILAVTRERRARLIGLSLAVVLALLVNKDGTTWGGWVLNCSPEEYAAADWINKNLPKDATLIANWYTGDYLRSLTLRKVVISDYPRVEVRVAMEKFKLNIPILPRSPEAVLDYVNRQSGDYYLVTAKWGPWGRYPENPNFELLETFGPTPKTQAKIFRIRRGSPESAPETQP